MVWNIVCDSSCDLRATDVKSESVQFETVPLRLQVGAREFLDNDQLRSPICCRPWQRKNPPPPLPAPPPPHLPGLLKRETGQSALPFPPISPAPITPR